METLVTRSEIRRFEFGSGHHGSNKPVQRMSKMRRNMIKASRRANRGK